MTVKGHVLATEDLGHEAAPFDRPAGVKRWSNGGQMTVKGHVPPAGDLGNKAAPFDRPGGGRTVVKRWKTAVERQ